MKIFCHHQKIFTKITFRVGLQYIFYVVILFNTAFYLELTFKLKIDLKMCTFKNLEDIQKTWKKICKKKSGNPAQDSIFWTALKGANCTNLFYRDNLFYIIFYDN